MKGMGASPGIAIGKAFIKKDEINIVKELIQDINKEIDRFYRSLEQAKIQIQELWKVTETKMGKKEADIFEAHLLILEDPEVKDKIVNVIKNEGVNAEWAISLVIEEYRVVFEAIDDEYLKERIVDLKDVANRMIKNLLGVGDLDYENMEEPVIIIAKDLTPSDTAQIPKEKVLGLITEEGGTTSHTAIISNILEIPAIVGCSGLKEIKNGDMMAMDGETGEVYVNPNKEIKQLFDNRQKAHEEYKKGLTKYIGKESITKDGHRVEIACNIKDPQDLDLVLKNDGEGIGLFRSEFLYMDRKMPPTEDEQFESYKIVAEGMKGKPVIIRTLDVGGDKQIEYLNLPKEDNPFLGYRAIRYCLDKEEIFQTQLKAILRASAFGKVKIMFPMIASVEEIIEAKNQLNIAKMELKNNNIEHDDNMEIGIMIEIPSAAIISDQLAEEVDFFSIGTNDLIQYTIAVDRMNPKISNLYTPFHPAVLRLIKLVIDHAHQANKWVGMCGEAAGNELLAPLFIAMGIDELSVSPPLVLKTRKLVHQLNKADLSKEITKILKLKSADEVRQYLIKIN
ncbi:phosphoenolpyruvate--protein phosphotransferase [Alkaliphilus transvaalensis]|uniref:phosphoenolpyruvate--protein phosphotransferase n=1 Tax=Alkaliphilus transvaalensis TaxID=114628 RepID=UPI00047D2769|nr:phosphoenolpyruvate--protein phosphotransferase [Alkaliphilus transvaalensis]